MEAGESLTFSVPKDWNAARVWARTNCRSVNGRFTCETGDCGFEQCAHDGIQRGKINFRIFLLLFPGYFIRLVLIINNSENETII